MAAFTVTTTAQTVYISTEGTATVPDEVTIQLADGASGNVYIQRNAEAVSDESAFISDGATWDGTLTAGQYISVVTDTGTVDILVGGEPTGFTNL